MYSPVNMGAKNGPATRQVRIPEDVLSDLASLKVGDESWGSVIRRLLEMHPCPHGREPT